MLTVVQDAREANGNEAGRRSLLDGIVRDGARQMLAAVTVTAPRVNDKRVDADTVERQRFSSAILPAWVRKSPQMTEVLPSAVPARPLDQ